MAEPATAAPAATNGAAPPPEPSAVGLVDILEGIASEPEKPETEAEAKSAPEQEKPKGDKKAEKDPPKLAGEGTEKPDHEAAMDATDDLLSSGELTPEAAATVKAALDATRARNKILDRYDMRIKRKDKRQEAEYTEKSAALDKKQADWEQSIHPAREAARGVMAELAILDPRSGANARERFAAIARLNGGLDGQQLYEEWTLGIASDGNVPAPSRSETALRQEIDQLRAALHQKLQGDQQAAGQAKVTEMRQFVAGQVEEIKTLARDAEQFPAIAAWIGDDDDGESLGKVANWAKAAIVKAADAGKVLDKASALGKVEARLARLKGATPVEAAKAAESGSSQSPGGPARGAGKGTTVLPTSADRSTGHVREPRTEQERDAENLRDPQFRAALPFLR